MAWTTPQFTKRQVDFAGARLAEGPLMDPNGYNQALEIINNWRSSHSFPLNTFQTTLRRKGRKIDPECLVAQRIKRLSSVSLKLRRYPGLRLSQMQDIGGCRIVLRDIKAVRDAVATYRRSDLKHDLARIDDYLLKPQVSGYRGVHLIYRYNSDKNDVYNSLKIEMQIRSQFQHAWATAVETVGTFIRQSLKSSMGERDWLRFFALMGTIIAISEGTTAVQHTPIRESELIHELQDIAIRLDVVTKLEAYGKALQYFEENHEDQEFFLLILDPAEAVVRVKSYSRFELERAQAEYLEAEKSAADSGTDVVLVSVDSVTALQRAYPNYFLDTRVFISLVEDALERRPLAIEEAANIEPQQLTLNI